MAETTDLSEQIAENATDNIRNVTVDGHNVTTHSLPDQIAADKHLASKAVASNPFNAMKTAKLKPPGTAGSRFCD
jgi:hypothetical protein